MMSYAVRAAGHDLATFAAVEMKHCRPCGRDLPRDAFSPKRGHVQSRCRECQAAVMRERRRAQWLADREDGPILPTKRARRLQAALEPVSPSPPAPARSGVRKARARLPAGARVLARGEVVARLVELRWGVAVGWRGGTNERSNLRVLCTTCNTRKGTKEESA